VSTDQTDTQVLDRRLAEVSRERDRLLGEVQELYEQLAAVMELSNQEADIAYGELKAKISDLERKVFELALLNDLARAVSSNLDLEGLAGAILERMSSLFPVEAALLMSAGPGEVPRVIAASGIRGSDIPARQLREVWESAGREPWVVDDLGESSADQKLRIHASSVCAAVVPLVAKNTTEGILLLNSADPGAFRHDQLTLLSTFGRQCGVAMANARLFEDLNELKEFNESILQNIPIGVAVLDADGKVLSTNAAFRSQFGDWSRMGSGGASSRVAAELSKLGFAKELERVAKFKVPVTASGVKLPVEGGNTVILNVHLQPLIVGEELCSVILLVEDVTEEQKLQDELIRSEKLAAKGEMAAEIAHELNNYLTPLAGMVQLIPIRLAQGDVAKATEYCEVIAGEADKMARLVRGLLDFSHVDAKKVSCDLNEIIRSAVNFVKPQNRYDDVAFEVELEETLEPVLADPGQLQQVLLNLFGNAADALKSIGKKDGKIRVTTGNGADGKSVLLEVSDEGPGIPESIKHKILEPGFTTKKTGHGFGLAVCGRIVETHDGKLNIVSEPDRGTTISISLPTARAAAESSSGPAGRG